MPAPGRLKGVLPDLCAISSPALSRIPGRCDEHLHSGPVSLPFGTLKSCSCIAGSVRGDGGQRTVDWIGSSAPSLLNRRAPIF